MIYNKLINNLYTIACVIYIGMILIYINTFFTDRPRFGILFFGMSIFIFILRAIRGEFHFSKRLFRNKKIIEVIAVIFTIIIIIITVYFWKEFSWLIYERAGSANKYDIICGGIAILLVLLSVLLSSGPAIVFVAMFFIFYSLFGRYFPGILKFNGFSVVKVIDICSVQILRGIFGDLLQLGGTLVAVFIIFAGFVKGLGGFDVIIKISLIIANKSKYLITQSAVVASAIMGMFSGSGTGNVAATGSFTIPLMKNYKVPSHFAGAIEAVASAGGQLMPPIMGAAAFLMAEYLGVPYIKIALMGVLPALLYFAGVSFSVYNISRIVKIEIPRETKENMIEEMSTTKEGALKLLLDSIPLLIGLISLLFIMIVLKYEAIVAGYYTIIVFTTVRFVIGFIVSLLNRKSVKMYFKKFGEMLIEGVKNSAGIVMQIGLMLSCIEIIVVIISTSGIGIKLNMLLISIGAENIWLSLLLAAIVCIMLGCVVATVAVYILAMVTVVPVLLRLGIDPYVAHFYVFWFAIVGLITPPVAGNVVAACGIAKSGFLKTAKEAIKIGAGLIILPIVMILYPEILIHNSRTPLIFIFVLISLYALSMAFYGGYILKGGKGSVGRLFCILVSLTLLIPGVNEYIKCIICGIFFICLFFIFTKKMHFNKNVL